MAYQDGPGGHDCTLLRLCFKAVQIVGQNGWSLSA